MTKGPPVSEQAQQDDLLCLFLYHPICQADCMVHFYTLFRVPCEHPLPLPVGKGKVGAHLSKSLQALSVTCGEQLSQRESQGSVIACWHEKWSVSVPIHSINCFTTTHQVPRFLFIQKARTAFRRPTAAFQFTFIESYTDAGRISASSISSCR